MKFRTASVLAALLCAAQLTLSAPAAPAAEAAEPARVSVAYAGIPLKDALRQFQEVSGLRLAYAEDLLAGAAPVTLKRGNAPAEKVLRELLRPQGLEAVLTDKNLAAIVPAWSDLGMAKAFGRALSTGLRLGNKLDGAVVEGDEVRVPGWTADDDEDLALGITDFVAAIAYASSRSWINSGQGVQDERVEAIRALLRSADPLVRAGALTLLANYGVMNSGIREFGREIEQGFADPHPAVRTASAIQFAVSTGRGNGQWEGQTAAAAMLRKLAADPEAGVRMAAAFALLIGSHHVLNPAMDPDGALLDQLLADRSALVRQTLRLGALALNNPRAGAPEGPAKEKWLALNSDEGLKATLHDPNPIARAVGFALASILQQDQQLRNKAAARDRVAAVWTEAELAKDPWMKTVHGLIAPALAGDYQVALEKTVAAAGSENPSHQAAALLSLGLGSTLYGRGSPQVAARGEKPTPPKIPDLAPLTARLAASKWLWGRLSGLALDAALPFVGPLSATPPSPEALKAAADRQQAALRDPSEPVRLVALFALYGRTMAGLPCPPEPVVAALRGRRLPEMLLGAQLANQGLATERLLEEINVLLDDPSRRTATEALLGGIWRNRSLLRVANTARLDFARQLAEQVIARNDPALDIALFKNQWIWIQDTALREEMEERVLKSASLEAVAARYRNRGIETTQAVFLFDRLRAAAADPAQRTAVLEAWAVLSGRLYNAPDRTNPEVVLSLLDRAMAGEPADARAAAARVRALPTLFSDRNNAVMQEQWAVAIERLPASLAKALEQALARAGEAEPSALTIDLLVETLNVADSAGGVKRGWLREAWSANHPTLIQALDSAVQKVLVGPREDIKLRVWSELARSGDKRAVEALVERILDGRAPDQTLNRALIAASENPGLLPPGFLPALLETIRDPAGNLSRRVQLISVLNSCPSLWGNTLSEGLERLVWDDQAAVPLRSASLQMLISVLPNSDGRNPEVQAKRRAVIRQAVAAYGTLPVAMILDNLDGLTGSGKETLEEELLVRVIEDKRLRGENDWMTYESIFHRLAQSRGLETLQDPERLRQALDRLEREFPTERRVTPRGFQGRGLQELRQKLGELY